MVLDIVYDSRVVRVDSSGMECFIIQSKFSNVPGKVSKEMLCMSDGLP